MPYDPLLADRIRNLLTERAVEFSDRRMMGGLMVKVDGKMLCGIYVDKKEDENLLMARVGKAVYEREIEKEECRSMDSTGRPMGGYLFIGPEGTEDDHSLGYWLDLCLEFNPLAKASKKQKKK